MTSFNRSELATFDSSFSPRKPPQQINLTTLPTPHQHPVDLSPMKPRTSGGVNREQIVNSQMKVVSDSIAANQPLIEEPGRQTKFLRDLIHTS